MSRAHETRRVLRGSLLALLCVAALPGAAAPADTALQPRGPVTVTADRAEWEQAGVMLYTGNVRLSADGLELMGERLELRQAADGQYEARVSGAPARLAHAATDSSPAVAAQARELTYDSQKGTAQLDGRAQVERGADRLSGERIVYEVAARRIQAAGGSAGQVRIVIQPPAKPAPEARKP